MSGITTRVIEGLDGRPATVKSGRLGLIDRGDQDNVKNNPGIPPAVVSLAEAVQFGNLNEAKAVLHFNPGLDLNHEVVSASSLRKHVHWKLTSGIRPCMTLRTLNCNLPTLSGHRNSRCGPITGFHPRNTRPLVFALNAEENVKELTQLLLEHKADPNYVTSDKTVAINSACSRGYVDVVEVLLEHKADPTISIKDLNALGSAVTCTDTASKLELIELLCKQGLSPNNIGDPGMTALHLSTCGDVSVVRALLEAKADPTLDNMIIPVLSPHIHYAVPDENAVAITRELVRAGARVNDVGPEGLTPLHVAAASVSPAIAKVLLELGADKSAKDSAGRTAHDVAEISVDCRPDYVEVVGYMSILEDRTDAERREILELTKL